MSSPPPSLNIHVVRSPKAAYLVFDGREAAALRSNTYRVFSNFIGSRSRPADASTAKEKETDESLPLQLTELEVCNLVDAFGHRVNLFETTYKGTDSTSADFDRFRAQLEAHSSAFHQKQIDEYRSKRIEELFAIKDRILAGKRAKLTKRLAEIDQQLEENENQKESSATLRLQRDQIEQEINNLEAEFMQQVDSLKRDSPTTSEFTPNVEVFIKTPGFYESLFPARLMSHDEFSLSAASVYRSCKFHTYRHFWSRGFYLTGGAKFGGDFLVYPGEPSRYHSQFILVCVESIDSWRALKLQELITYARMATSVKKTFVLAVLFFNDSPDAQPYPQFTVKLNHETYLGLISLNWSHI